jgi:hypothetical protein
VFTPSLAFIALYASIPVPKRARDTSPVASASNIGSPDISLTPKIVPLFNTSVIENNCPADPSKDRVCTPEVDPLAVVSILREISGVVVPEARNANLGEAKFE